MAAKGTRHFTYAVYKKDGKFYVMLNDADTGSEAGYMQHNGRPTQTEGLKQEFDSRELASLGATSWGHTL